MLPGSPGPLESEAQQNVLQNPMPYEGPFDAQDMRTYGGLKRFMPATSITFLIATLAIAGFPPLAGYFSKDEILFKAFELIGWLKEDEADSH